MLDLSAVELAQNHLDQGNTDQARAVFRDAETRASTSDELGLVASVVLSDPGDEEWRRPILNRAGELAPSATSSATLASHALQIGDVDLARYRTTSVRDAMGVASIRADFR